MSATLVFRTGFASSEMCISKGGPSIGGRGRWGHVLNTLCLNSSLSQASILELFSGVAGNGNFCGRSGTALRIGQEQFSEPLTLLGKGQPAEMFANIKLNVT